MVTSLVLSLGIFKFSWSEILIVVKRWVPIYRLQRPLFMVIPEPEHIDEQHWIGVGNVLIPDDFVGPLSQTHNHELRNLLGA